MKKALSVLLLGTTMLAGCGTQNQPLAAPPKTVQATTATLDAQASTETPATKEVAIKAVTKAPVVKLAASKTKAPKPVVEAPLPEPKPAPEGTYSTSFRGSSEGRIANIKLAAAKLNDIVILPNQSFSFLKAVGNANNPGDGWQEAIVIIDKQHTTGIGGGICQVSSTLYNAVTQLNLNVTEVHHHSLEVAYVPEGKDATVSWDYLDFKFVNTSGVPLKISTTTSGTNLTISLIAAE